MKKCFEPCFDRIQQPDIKDINRRSAEYQVLLCTGCHVLLPLGISSTLRRKCIENSSLELLGSEKWLLQCVLPWRPCGCHKCRRWRAADAGDRRTSRQRRGGRAGGRAGSRPAAEQRAPPSHLANYWPESRQAGQAGLLGGGALRVASCPPRRYCSLRPA